LEDEESVQEEQEDDVGGGDVRNFFLRIER
jgi:hypothetical protein